MVQRRTRNPKGRGFESLPERREENRLLQSQLSVLTPVSVSVSPRVTAVARKSPGHSAPAVLREQEEEEEEEESRKRRKSVGEWGWGVEGKQAGSMDEESQVRGCYNITFICTPTRKQCRLSPDENMNTGRNS